MGSRLVKCIRKKPEKYSWSIVLALTVKWSKKCCISSSKKEIEIKCYLSWRLLICRTQHTDKQSSNKLKSGLLWMSNTTNKAKSLFCFIKIKLWAAGLVLLLRYLTCKLSVSIAKFGVNGDCAQLVTAPHFSLFLVTRYFQLRQVSVVKTEYFLIRST